MSVLTVKNLDSVRRLVDNALDLAAAVTLPRFRQPIAIDNKAEVGFDPVTVADREAEQVLRDVLMSALPNAGFLGEEDSVAQVMLHAVTNTEASATATIDIDPALQKCLNWVVDPIDGTRAFITGLPLWGTLVALNDGENVLFGALDQPWMQERFVGFGDRAERVCRGEVSLLRTRAPRPLSEIIVQTTTPDMFGDEASRKGFEQARKAVAMMRYGGDCYAYALLAMGGVDAVIESSLQPYDIQALIPIVEGAGGVITNWDGKPCLAGGSVIAAANAQVHDALLNEVNR